LEYGPNATLWGARMVMSANMTAGNFLAGAFRGNSLLVDREEVNVQVAEQNVDDFEKNMYTVRIEERLANVVFTPAAFEKGVVPVVIP
jgi:HK97 family phage major capsid protein